MSLLIKALANAEKDKQAELNKKQASLDEGVLSLELAPIDAKSNDLKHLGVNVKSVDEKSVNAKSVDAKKTSDRLSLEDEAGLWSIPAKIKSSTDKVVDKSSTQVGALKGHLKETPQAAKPINRASDPVVASTTLQSPTTQSSASQTTVKQSADVNQKAAAKVFVANQAAKTSSSKISLVMLGVAGAAIILLVTQEYSYFRSLATQDVVVVKPSAPIQPTAATVTVVEPAQNTQEVTITQVEAKPEVALLVEEQAKQNTGVAEIETSKKSASKAFKASKAIKNSDEDNVTEISSVENSEALQNPSKKASNRTSKRTPLKLTTKSPVAGVDPTLLLAYEAFNRGEDASAQQQYRQVLQHDVRNVDALLGMAAIAQRQGRDADAVGWYQKVLDIEPRNTIAQSAIVSPQVNNDAVGAESRIKSMLAQQPEAANLHAALGNLYAEQNQWASAQGAYFDASRFAPNNADYAFNLAISLDQLGKSALALKQYQRALELLNQSGGTSPDRATLEARIQALQ
ncbi:MAG: hypothetical protein WBC07_06195 [Methylotenera sp.]